MISPTDIPSVRSPVFLETAATASVTTNITQEALSNLTQNAVGKLFQAQVLAQLDDGTFVVNVADNAVRMALPAGTTVGDTLEMTLLASDPRPAFLLEQQGNDTSASLSSAAKLINTVLQTAQQAGAPTTLIGKTPLVASSAASTPELAAALQDSVEFSGVFYESHLSQWVDGERPLSDLLREPQIQAQDEAPAAGKMPIEGTGTVLPRPPVTETELSNLMNNIRSAPESNALLNALSNSNNNLPKEADTIVRSATLTQENAQTVNLQLNALEQNRIAWQGELWPGQHMEWEISEDTHGRSHHGDADADQTSWQSVVRFELPSLGKISASIHLSGGHVRMQVTTLSNSSAAALKAHGDELATALGAAGSPLDLLIIKQDDQV
jgi:hypothetical protein